jgi:cold shock CspA family protein
MPVLFHDRIKETSTSTGTGNFTLAGAVSQHVTFSSRYSLTDIFYYAITLQGGTEWEVGQGYLSASSTLVRGIVYESSNSDTFVSFSSGTKDVFITFSAIKASVTPTRGQVIAVSTGQAMP